MQKGISANLYADWINSVGSCENAAYVLWATRESTMAIVSLKISDK